jgi:hypothetical protein
MGYFTLTVVLQSLAYVFIGGGVQQILATYYTVVHWLASHLTVVIIEKTTKCNL